MVGSRRYDGVGFGTQGGWGLALIFGAYGRDVLCNRDGVIGSVRIDGLLTHRKKLRSHLVKLSARSPLDLAGPMPCIFLRRESLR